MKHVLFIFIFVVSYFGFLSPAFAAVECYGYNDYYSFFRLDDEMFLKFANETIYFGSPSEDAYNLAHKALKDTFVELAKKEGQNVVDCNGVWVEYLCRYINALHRCVSWLEREEKDITFDDWLGGSNFVEEVFIKELKCVFVRLNADPLMISEDLRKELLVINRRLSPQDQYYASVIEEMWKRHQKAK
jgi:hypothetical protein